MSVREHPASLRRSAGRVEGRLWTGPAGHLMGGALDLIEAFARYLLLRARARARRAR